MGWILCKRGDLPVCWIFFPLSVLTLESETIAAAAGGQAVAFDFAPLTSFTIAALDGPMAMKLLDDKYGDAHEHQDLLTHQAFAILLPSGMSRGQFVSQSSRTTVCPLITIVKPTHRKAAAVGRLSWVGCEIADARCPIGTAVQVPGTPPNWAHPGQMPVSPCSGLIPLWIPYSHL